MRNKKKTNKKSSYINQKKNMKKFFYKDFSRSESYNTNFTSSEFLGINFLNASMKYCNFNNCTFDFVEFENTKLNGSNFKGAHFRNVLFKNCNLTKTNFNNATFTNVFLYNTSFKNLDNKKGIEIITEEKLNFSIDNELSNVIDLCRKNALMLNSSPIFNQKKKSEEKYFLNKLSIIRLERLFSNEEIIKGFKKTNENIDKEFNTLSRLVKYIQSN